MSINKLSINNLTEEFLNKLGALPDKFFRPTVLSMLNDFVLYDNNNMKKLTEKIEKYEIKHIYNITTSALLYSYIIISTCKNAESKNELIQLNNILAELEEYIIFEPCNNSHILTHHNIFYDIDIGDIINIVETLRPYHNNYGSAIFSNIMFISSVEKEKILELFN